MVTFVDGNSSSAGGNDGCGGAHLFHHLQSSATTTNMTSHTKTGTAPGCNNKSGEKTTFRRKWILEKWLIWITLFATSILLDSAYGEVMCYECVWQGSTPLPSTKDGVSDICRPHNFNVDVVHKIKCANGCVKQALYEFENSPSSPPRQGTGNNSTGNATASRNRTLSIENMTFYKRGCDENKKTRETCENKSFIGQVHTQDCFCLTDYCNGESNGAASHTLFQLFGGGSGSVSTSGDTRKISRKTFLSYYFTTVDKISYFFWKGRSLVELGTTALLLNYCISKFFSIINATTTIVSQ